MKYKVQMMTERDYENYMGGSNNYRIKEFYAETEDNKEEVKRYFEEMYPKKVINVVPMN